MNLRLRKKKESKVETVCIAEIESFNTPSPYLLPLTNLFAFNFFFLILPDVISDNTPVPFL